MISEVEPKLAAPGAGLPKVELLIGRTLSALKRQFGSSAAFNAQFTSQRARISQLVQQCEPAALARRVLIARAIGMEDSSRHWSVLMTLDHLRIVHLQIARVIDDLANDRDPVGQASTAAVKPSPDVISAVISEYENSCDALLATVAASPNLKTGRRFAHPWFGPMDANGWHAMAAGHLSIHRVQIERICAGLSRSKP